MPGPKGIYTRGAADGLCLVVGCAGKALYKGDSRSKRGGYCTKHKEMALSRSRAIEERCGESLMADVERWESKQPTWVAQVEDENQ